MAEKILLVDDEPDMLSLLTTIITGHTDYQVETTSRPLEVSAMLKETAFELAIIDLKMPDMDGIDLLDLIKREKEETAVVILTAYGTIPSAVEAMRKGAYDYITKPFARDQILLVIEKVLNWQRMKNENVLLRRSLEDKFQFQYLMGSSPTAQMVSRQVRQAAETDAPIILRGEIGTGKELIAKAVHFHSLRGTKDFAALYCGSLPDNLVEFELFGGMKEIAPGNLSMKTGVLEKAHQGTLFIDEIGALKTEIQARLVRALEHREFERLGDIETKKVDIRLVASTSGDLLEDVRSGRFLKELYYLTNVIEILIPPLRERKEDIPVLADHFLKIGNRVYEKKIDRISPNALQWLLDRDWPGNMRELENVIERGVILAKGDALEPEDLFPADYVGALSFSLGAEFLDVPFERAKEKFRIEYMKRMLSTHGGDVSKAAKASGLEIKDFELLTVDR
ncbi:MAG: sigma-54 dependent transcriptional regulator [Pseudomonadota bacterium]